MPSNMDASLSDVFTSVKNIVTAINSSSLSLAKNFSNNTALGVSRVALIKSGATRLISFSVIQSGMSIGRIFDALSIDVVNGYTILSAIANGNTIVVTFAGGYTFPIGSTILIENTGAGLDGAYPVVSSSAGTLTASTTLTGTTNMGKIGSGSIITTIPNTLGIVEVNWPVSLGIVIQPGLGQILSVSWQ